MTTNKEAWIRYHTRVQAQRRYNADIKAGRTPKFDYSILEQLQKLIPEQSGKSINEIIKEGLGYDS